LREGREIGIGTVGPIKRELRFNWRTASEGGPYKGKKTQEDGLNLNRPYKDEEMMAVILLLV